MSHSQKALLAIGLTLLGFVFPVVFLGAAILAFSLYSSAKGPVVAPGDARYPRGLDVTGDWLQEFRDCLDSPAEVAFLEAMVRSFDLKPRDHALRGADIVLRMQVSVSRYRLDFLVDQALVVEIDGAAWHSSPEAVSRDATRDADLRELGYTILRIPARLVFRTPEEALRQVREARGPAEELRLQRGRDVRDSLRPSSLVATARAGLRDFDAAMDRLLVEQVKWAEEQKGKTSAEHAMPEVRELPATPASHLSDKTTSPTSVFMRLMQPVWDDREIDRLIDRQKDLLRKKLTGGSTIRATLEDIRIQTSITALNDSENRPKTVLEAQTRVAALEAELLDTLERRAKLAATLGSVVPQEEAAEMENLRVAVQRWEEEMRWAEQEAKWAEEDRAAKIERERLRREQPR